MVYILSLFAKTKQPYKREIQFSLKIIGGTSFVDLLCFSCLVFAMPLFASVYMCLGSRLWCLTVSLSLSHWYPGSGVVLDCIDS